MLRFNSDHQFRILIIADIQDRKPLDDRKQQHLDKLITACKPDLVVLLGDVIFGPLVYTERRVRRIIETALEPLSRHQIPFAFVSGNHDMDCLVSLSRQTEIYREYPLCLTPTISERKCKGAYTLDVCDDETPSAKLLFLDSGGTHLSLHGILYDPATHEQLRFTEDILLDNSCPPVFVFQHIPVPEIFRLIHVSTEKTQDSVPGHGTYRGKQLTLKDSSKGILGECPCPSFTNTEQFSPWAKSGKVRAAVFGHDHKNSFMGVIDGVTFIQASCAGLSCYGRDDLRGGQLLTLYSNGQFETEPLYYSGLA